MLEALDEMGIQVARISGSSIGTVIGFLYAAGMTGKGIRGRLNRCAGTEKGFTETARMLIRCCTGLIVKILYLAFLRCRYKIATQLLWLNDRKSYFLAASPGL